MLRISHCARQLMIVLAVTFSLTQFGLAWGAKSSNSVRPLSATFTMLEHPIPSEGVAISFPPDWTETSPDRNEIIYYVGLIREARAACFIRVSEVPGLEHDSLDNYLSAMSEDSWVKLNSITAPDIVVHLFDLAYLGNRRARRIIYSATDSGLKLGNLVYQTLNRDKIFTAACATRQEDFHLIYGELDKIIYSFRFLD